MSVSHFLTYFLQSIFEQAIRKIFTNSSSPYPNSISFQLTTMTTSTHVISGNNAFVDEKYPRILLNKVADELESMRLNSPTERKYCPLPNACRELIRSLPGNHRCADCGKGNPQWASVGFGCLLCIQCSGRHRSFGVNVSRVCSITMDNWLYCDILAMLEGGNSQLKNYFAQHELSYQDKYRNANLRYKTNTAQFYRDNLNQHAKILAFDGKYKGRKGLKDISSKRISARRHSKLLV